MKDAVPETVVFCNTGCTVDNIERQLTIADGAVVGTTFKVDGKFDNLVDESRVRIFMDKVKRFRG
ncbi:putative sgc region protein SgcQ [compost metagenome]